MNILATLELMFTSSLQTSSRRYVLSVVSGFRRRCWQNRKWVVTRAEVGGRKERLKFPQMKVDLCLRQVRYQVTLFSDDLEGNWEASTLNGYVLPDYLFYLTSPQSSSTK